MKKSLIFLAIVLVVYGCGRRMPRPPRAEFTGIMEVHCYIPGKGYPDILTGNFRLDGFKDEFIVIFSDYTGVPRGEVEVRGRKVKYTGMKAGEDLAELLRFWTFIFNPAKGRKTDKIEIGDIKLKYSGWTKTEKGRFPGEVDIISPDININVHIIYGI